MKLLRTMLPALLALTLCAGAASASHLLGTITCAATGEPLAGIQIQVVSTDPANPYVASGTSDATGTYYIALVSFPVCLQVSAVLGAGESVVSPSGGTYLLCIDGSGANYTQNWVISSPSCGTSSGACWLTGGGAKFSAITNGTVGDYGKSHNWGGNVYPGCSSTAGDGGSWNDIDNNNRLHFHGTTIHVIRCGNIDGIPPGSTSPVTPFNYIEFEGTGTLKGIKGNKADFGTVHFWAHCEDRNEPGSNGQRDGAGKDRYFLNVFTDPAHPAESSIYLVDNDGDPLTMDPVTITDGNMQIHITSCSTPPVSARLSLVTPGIDTPAPVAVSHSTFFAMPYPNPVKQETMMRFGVASPAQVSMRVFDAAGRQVKELASGSMVPGEYSTLWDLTNRYGERVSAGVYFVRLAVGAHTISRTVTVTN